MDNCKSCVHSRALVNKRTVGRVGCIFATDNDFIDERIRELNLEIKEEFIYPERNSTVRQVGITVKDTSLCQYHCKED